MSRLIIAGSRTLAPRFLVGEPENADWSVAEIDSRLTRFLSRRIEYGLGTLGLTGRITEAISGGAVGADTYGARWATERGIAVTSFPPQYDQFADKKQAPLARNDQMAFYASADVQKGALVLITLEASSGSLHMKRQAEREGLAIWHDDWQRAALWAELSRNARYIGCLTHSLPRDR